MYDIQLSTTAYPLIFFMNDSTDHVTGKTGLTPTVTISKAGGSFASPSGSVTEIANGWYKVAGNATDSNTLGPLLLHATGTAADPCDTSYQVVAYNPQLNFSGTAAAGAAGGLTIAGSNAATTFATLTVTGATTLTGNVAAAAGITVTNSTTNGAGLSVTGNGTGAGIAVAAGATGKGVAVTTTAGDGISVLPTAGHALVLTANGTSKHGLIATGGTAGTSDGVSAVAGTGGTPIRGDITGTLSALSSTALTAIGGAVLDTGTASHLVSGSLGAALSPTDQGTAQAGGANTITLRSGASATNSYYNKQLLWIVAGTGAGQSEYITGYVGSTRAATMAASWAIQPDNTSVYVIKAGGTIPGASAPTAAEVADAVFDEAMSGHLSAGTFGAYINYPVTRTATAQAGTTSSITLDASASATNNLYRYHGVEIVGGTGAGEASFVTGYTGTSKVAAVDPPFTVAPDATSVFVLRKYGIDAATPTQVASAVWAATRAANATAGTFGEYVIADAQRIATSATAANNAKNTFDGSTGYGFTNCTMPTTTTVSGNVNGNVGGNVTGSVGSVVGAVGSVTGAVGSVTGAVGSVAGNIGGNVVGSVASVTAAVTAGTVTDKTGYALSNAGVDALFTRALTESYAADGAAPTVAQALFLIQQRMTEFGISSTTMTIKKLDGTTTAAVLTLNDASAPTAVARTA